VLGKFSHVKAHNEYSDRDCFTKTLNSGPFMPRRRSTKARASGGKLRPVDRSEGKIKKWDKISDIPLDEEDQCALNYITRARCTKLAWVSSCL
jgi:hypothetical protein